MDDEKQRAAEREAESKCIEWLHTQLIELSGFDFDEETEIKPVVQKYLQDNKKQAIELTQKDWENIYADILIPYLDSLVK